MSCLLNVTTAWATSIDCSKASTKAEHLICEDPDISKQDEEMSELYSEVFKKIPNEELFKKQQQEWIDARNRCEDISCLKRYYQGRIAELQVANEFKNEESYTLLMSKNDELCTHMLQLFNEDLERYGWKGDAHQEEHQEFKKIPWKPARFSSVIDERTEYTDVDGALFDFNNDGAQEFVVRWKSSLSDMRSDSIHILSAEAMQKRNDLEDAGFSAAEDSIALGGGFYKLMPPFLEPIAGVRVLEPFIYDEVSYLVIRPLFERLPNSTGYAAITKYGGGRFSIRDVNGKMEDICYYQRNRAKRSR
jgi:uncharacterized protein